MQLNLLQAYSENFKNMFVKDTNLRAERPRVTQLLHQIHVSLFSGSVIAAILLADCRCDHHIKSSLKLGAL